MKGEGRRSRSRQGEPADSDAGLTLKGPAGASDHRVVLRKSWLGDGSL